MTQLRQKTAGPGPAAAAVPDRVSAIDPVFSVLLLWESTHAPQGAQQGTQQGAQQGAQEGAREEPASGPTHAPARRQRRG